MNPLLTEILACLAAASLFSLLMGWVIRSVVANNDLKANDADWSKMNAKLESEHKKVIHEYDEKIEQLDRDKEQLVASNDSLSESLQNNEASVLKARADAIELNRQQAETQERLQRIIYQKDEELKRFRASARAASTAAVTADNAQRLSIDETEAQIRTLTAKRDAWEKERQKLLGDLTAEQQTLVIDPVDVPDDMYDQTVRLDDTAFQATQSDMTDNLIDTDLLQQTEMLDMTESTIALDKSDLQKLNPAAPDSDGANDNGSSNGDNTI